MPTKESKWAGIALVGVVVVMILSTQVSAQIMGQPIPPVDQAPEQDRGTYRNPFQLEQEWIAYGIGDPFVLRWNGRYYLYPSTKTHAGGEVGVRVWVSEDLVHWNYAGYASRDLVTYNAFAPEVVYWDGSFYMYQSSNGEGHFVLKSEEPTGPFTAQTGNLGLSIDGSVFIDDDGSWYFTHAGFRGIRGYAMTDPYTVGAPRLLEADLGAWTEGSMIIKRGGYYFMTYTGNHIRSAGYRIYYAVSEDGPLGRYVEGENNPLLLSTDDHFHGLGHNSLVLSPDLDGYYIVYHNIYNRLDAHIRKMNIDRLVFNGKKMAVLGPTRFPQIAPRLPDFFTWIDEEGTGDRWTEHSVGEYALLLSRDETQSQFTAEFNFQLDEKPACRTPSLASPHIGAVVSYRGDHDFIAALIDPCENTLGVWEVKGGEWRLLERNPLQAEFDFTKLHTLRFARESGRIQLYFDQMLLSDLAIDGAPGGKIGYIHRDVAPIFRYTAYSNDAFGSSDRKVPKPIPGKIEAIHYSERGADASADSGAGGLPRWPDEWQVVEAGDGTFAAALAEPEEWLAYTVNVERDGVYAVDVVARTPYDATVLEWQIDGHTTLTSTLPETPPAAESGWFKAPLGRMELKAGLHTLAMVLRHGSVEVKRIDIYPVTQEPYSLTDPLNQGISDPWRQYGEGAWHSVETGLRLSRSRESMIIAGSREWTDYSVRVDLDVDGAIGVGEASLLVRATQPSYHPDQVRDSVVAFAVTVKEGRLSLEKLNYGSVTLVRAAVDTRGAHALKVEAEGPILKVYFDDMETPILEYADPDAWMSGAIGFRSNTMNVSFRNLSLQCTTCPVYGKVRVAEHTLWLTPYESKYEIVLPFGVVSPPMVQPMVTGQDSDVDVIAPDARIEVTQAVSIPGEARLHVVDLERGLLHEAVLSFSKIMAPTVHLDLPGGKEPRQGWAGEMAGAVPVIIDVNGPDELLESVRVMASRIEHGEAVDELVLYHGAAVPRGLVLDTSDLPDATYELAVFVKSIYGTEAKSSIRFRAANWSVFEDELLPPFESIFGLIDRSETVARSEGWRHETDSPGDFFGDRDRLVRRDDTTEYLVWEAPGLHEIVVTAYARKHAALKSIEISTSRDMDQWVALPSVIGNVRESKSGWLEAQLVGKVADHDAVSYVRVALLEGGHDHGAVRLGKVRLVSRP